MTDDGRLKHGRGPDGSDRAVDSFACRSGPLLVVVSGPSGAGKDTVILRMRDRGLPFHFVVTATSRAKRAGELHGVDYFFVSEESFRRMIADGELLEYACVYGQYKGVPRRQVEEAMASGQDVIMRLDVQGAETIRRLMPDAVLIFLLPGSQGELNDRLQQRRTETPSSLAQRMATFREEMGRLADFDYVVLNRNGELDAAVDQILAIIAAEKCRTVRCKVRI